MKFWLILLCNLYNHAACAYKVLRWQDFYSFCKIFNEHMYSIGHADKVAGEGQAECLLKKKSISTSIDLITRFHLIISRFLSGLAEICKMRACSGGKRRRNEKRNFELAKKRKKNHDVWILKNGMTEREEETCIIHVKAFHSRYEITSELTLETIKALNHIRKNITFLRTNIESFTRSCRWTGLKDTTNVLSSIPRRRGGQCNTDEWQRHTTG